MIAVDTNVLVGAIQTFDLLLRATARDAVKSLYRQGEQLLCIPQNLVEFCKRLDPAGYRKWSRLSSRAGSSISGPLSDAVAAPS
jgi:hypothetical protein